ncbi:CPBP family intramembrane glutamic endopeptidase [Ornithinimicrobium sp. INDO-MA30-4]|uniref:CPBP family intramembrane glutamic endopeptidase n=1 Tax=Ornithinimicrobium sp. INDO-MA30-4 TaxID=2908651 RepID=UPI001F33A478|nr:CPBP family intramembrane glutamic endopeptidase [Ornithinimicrobium sp. INDO-MA30-4]UJH70314.1 CPBP family intramembrane metalloprotease [Ornithinimicrobium sp. INDO-MA30-4]
MAGVSPAAHQLTRRDLVLETALVLGVSLGASALWSVLSLIRKVSADGSLSEQTTSMNSSVVEQPWLDLAYQVTGIVLALVPVLLALHLLGREDGGMRSAARSMGLTASNRSQLARAGRQGSVLTAVVGLPGLALYFGARALRLNTTIAAANLDAVWWAIPVLVLAAVQNAVLEEVIMIGYLFKRWGQAGWSNVAIILTSALIRGTYHFYQGFGGFVGNFVLGLLFGWLYLRTKRVLPLVIAHTLLDVVAFVGYAVLARRVGWL